MGCNVIYGVMLYSFGQFLLDTCCVSQAYAACTRVRTGCAQQYQLFLAHMGITETTVTADTCGLAFV